MDFEEKTLEELLIDMPKMLETAHSMLDETDVVVLANKGLDLALFFLQYLTASVSFAANPLIESMTLEDMSQELLGVSFKNEMDEIAPKDVVE